MTELSEGENLLHVRTPEGVRRLGAAEVRGLVTRGVLTGKEWASRDGQAFRPLARFPEFYDLFRGGISGLGMPAVKVGLEAAPNAGVPSSDLRMESTVGKSIDDLIADEVDGTNPSSVSELRTSATAGVPRATSFEDLRAERAAMVAMGNAVAAGLLDRHALDGVKPLRDRFDGDFGESSFLDLVLFLLGERATGYLQLRRGERLMAVAFSRGQVIAAFGDRDNDELSRALVDRKICEASIVDDARSYMAQRGGAFVDALVRTGAASATVLKAERRALVLERVLDLFKWEEGRFSYRRDDRALNEERFVELDTPALLRMGLDWAYDRRNLERKLSPYEGVGLVRGTPVAGSPIPVGLDLKILSSTDGVRDPWELAAAAADVPVSDVREHPDGIEALRSVYLLLSSRALEPRWVPGPRALSIRLERMERLDHFALLGVPRDCNREQVEEAWERQCGRYLHMDAEEPERSEVQDMRVRILARLERARDLLVDREARLVYRRNLEAGRDVDLRTTQAYVERRVFEARAEEALARFDYHAAGQAFEELVELHPEHWEYQFSRGWCAFLGSDDDAELVDGARQTIKKALSRAEDRTPGHRYLGHIARYLGELEDAVSHYTAVLEERPGDESLERLIAALGVEIKEAEERAKRAEAAEAEPSVSTEGSGWRVTAVGGITLLLLFITSNILELGVGEFSLSIDNAFFYMRRGLLLLAGVVGLVVLETRYPREMGWGAPKEWLAIAAGLGLLMGILSPPQYRASPLWAALPMVVLTVLSEEVFFRGYMAKILREDVLGDIGGLAASVGSYAVYHLTFHAIYSGFSFTWQLYYCALLGVGAGTAYTFMYYRSRSLLVPGLAHLLAYGIPVAFAHTG